MAKARDWAKLHRKLIRSDLWLSEEFTRGQAWVDLILMAAFKPGFVRLRGVKVGYERGQIATAERFLCERWKWSRGKVRRFLNELENERQVVQQKNNASTVITITNYESYQGDGTADETADGTTSSTTDGPQTGQQTDQSKERKEGKKEKKEKKGDTPLPPVELPPSIRTEPMTAAVGDWLAYKAERREGYKPTGMKKLYTQLSNAVAVHGEAAIIERLNRAMSSNWAGWDFAADNARGSPNAADDPRGNFAAANQYLESLKK